LENGLSGITYKQCFLRFIVIAFKWLIYVTRNSFNLFGAQFIIGKITLITCLTSDIFSISVIPVVKNDAKPPQDLKSVAPDVSVSKRHAANENVIPDFVVSKRQAAFENVLPDVGDPEVVVPDFVVSKRQTPVEGDCGIQLTSLKIGDTGNITSPNYPNNYPPSVKCAWWLQV
jgi:hypothetical protein